MKKAFVSWSGGKDSCLAYYRALNNGMDIRLLLNMVSEDGERSRSHGLSPKLMNMQSEAIGLPLAQRKSTWENYEDKFCKELLSFKEQGITDGIFGDIDMDEHLQWVERMCSRCGITPHLPLWGEDQSKLLKEFIDNGFKAVIVGTDAAIMGEEWLGREVDMLLMSDLAKYQNITPCGEAGEYHTFVTGGPVFKKNLMITKTEHVLMKNHWFLDIRSAEFSEK
jgi:diphthine-ammonia ligase